MPSNWELRVVGFSKIQMHASGSRIVTVASVVGGLVCSPPNCEARFNGGGKIERPDLFAVIRNEWRINSGRKRHADGRLLRLTRLRRLERRVGPTFAPWVFIEIHRGEWNNCVTTTRGYILYKAHEYARENGIQHENSATDSWILVDMTNVTLPFPCLHNVITYWKAFNS